MIYRIACLSVQHGHLPEVPECDLFANPIQVVEVEV